MSLDLDMFGLQHECLSIFMSPAFSNSTCFFLFGVSEEIGWKSNFFHIRFDPNGCAGARGARGAGATQARTAHLHGGASSIGGRAGILQPGQQHDESHDIGRLGCFLIT